MVDYRTRQARIVDYTDNAETEYFLARTQVQGDVEEAMILRTKQASPAADYQHYEATHLRPNTASVNSHPNCSRSMPNTSRLTLTTSSR
ncbi:hypothetical protein SAMN05444359_115125 [Neolewinella agarilytica]|uniref:Uncharacterized protein n=1 Tax=Neolewinella agarilytica TaxID=478744 RepID=A0A1H9ISY0_9BACT|nr:hypothetical protein SAMN05444359_115125 [Neolewinella agarilytica]